MCTEIGASKGLPSRCTHVECSFLVTRIRWPKDAAFTIKRTEQQACSTHRCLLVADMTRCITESLTAAMRLIQTGRPGSWSSGRWCRWDADRINWPEKLLTLAHCSVLIPRYFREPGTNCTDQPSDLSRGRLKLRVQFPRNLSEFGDDLLGSGVTECAILALVVLAQRFTATPPKRYFRPGL
jgi:hypothetical protein